MEKLRDVLLAVLGRMDQLQAQLGQAMGLRDGLIADDQNGIEAFAVKFRAAVAAEFGARLPQAHRVPRLNVSRPRANPAPPDTPKPS